MWRHFTYNTEKYNATNTQHMLKDWINIVLINLTLFNLNTITSAGLMIYNCISLTSIVYRKFGGLKLRWIDTLFRYCPSLIYFDLSNFETSRVTMMNLIFKDGYNMKSINLSNVVLLKYKICHIIFLIVYLWSL